MNKKGDLSLNTIVLAVVAVIVLVVLVAIFLNNIGTTNDQIQTCQGSCVAEQAGCGSLDPTGQTLYSKVTNTNCGLNQICCIKIGN